MNLDNLHYDYLVWQFKRSVSARIKLWRKLAKLLDKGIPLISALAEIRDRAKQSYGANHRNVVALNEWILGLEDGDMLNVVVADWVSLEEVLLISSGEASGEMPRAFGSIDLVMTSKLRIGKQVRSALRKPVIYFFAILAFILDLSYSVIPKFENMLHGQSWTGAAKATVDVASFARNWMWLLAIIFVLAVYKIVRSMPTWDGPMRIKADQHAPFSLYRLITGSAWVMSLSALVKGGMKIEEALVKIETNSTPWLANRTRDCIQGIHAGISLGEALHNSGKGFPDREVIDDLLIYSKHSGFDTALHLLGTDMLEETEAKISAQADVLEGAVMMIAGIILLLLYGGVFAMQQQMTSSFSGG